MVEQPKYAADPPLGVIPNYENPNKSVYLSSIALQAVCISLVGIIFCLRIYTRMNILGAFQSEDWLITVGFVLAVCYSIVALVMNHFGGGINAWEVDFWKIEPFGITVYCTMVLYGPCTFAIKASILVFLTRIFAPMNKTVTLLRCFLGILFIYYTLALVLKAAICRPVAKFWAPHMEGQCFDQRSLILADSVISVLSDAVLFVAPLPLTCNLQMQMRKRVKVAVVFSAGGLAVVCSVIRLVDIVRNGTSSNQTRVFMRVNLWGIAEVYIGIVTACMPVLPAFWKRHFGDESAGYSYDYNNSHTLDPINSRRTVKRCQYQFSPEHGSDENILINAQSDVTITSKTSTSKDRASSLPTSVAVLGAGGDGMITKTVEIQQTYE